MLILAIASAIVLMVIVTNLVDRSVEERTRDRLLRESALVGQPGVDVQAAARLLNTRITLIRSDGVVTADSEADIATMENHRNRPEVVAARQHGSGFSIRHSVTLGRDLFYLAHRVNERGDVVRLALPYAELQHVESEYEWGARAAIALVCALMFVTGSLAVRAITRPIREVSEAALAVANGDTHATPPDHGAAEIIELSSAIHRMKESLLEAIERVEAERRLGAAVFNTLPDGTVVIDRHFRIVDVNPRFGELLHVEVRNGQPLVNALRTRELFEPFEQALATGTSAHATVTRSDDQTWEVSVHPVAGESTAAVGILHDVTPFRRNESMRRRFIADVSHELRTPVASVAAAVETLSTLQHDDPEAKALVEVISRQAARMRELLDDLTDLTMIETGQVPLEITPVDVAAVAREVASDLRVSAEARRVGIDVSASSVARVEGDRRRIAQIVRNLIDNAVKFSPDSSSVQVTVDADASSVIFAVADSGEGIPEKELPRIFQRFYQVDRSRSKARPGTGLGLAIVKHLAQLHRATVDVDSTAGVGSTFRVTFPRLQEES